MVVVIISGVLHEHPRIGSDGESEEVSLASDPDVTSPVKMRHKNRRTSEVRQQRRKQNQRPANQNQIPSTDQPQIVSSFFFFSLFLFFSLLSSVILFIFSLAGRNEVLLPLLKWIVSCSRGDCVA